MFSSSKQLDRIESAIDKLDTKVYLLSQEIDKIVRGIQQLNLKHEQFIYQDPPDNEHLAELLKGLKDQIRIIDEVASVPKPFSLKSELLDHKYRTGKAVSQPHRTPDSDDTASRMLSESVIAQSLDDSSTSRIVSSCSSSSDSYSGWSSSDFSSSSDCGGCSCN